MYVYTSSTYSASYTKDERVKITKSKITKYVDIREPLYAVSSFSTPLSARRHADASAHEKPSYAVTPAVIRQTKDRDRSRQNRVEYMYLSL